MTSNPITVLVVEDDSDVRTTTSLVLRRRGFDVVEAPDGVEGLDAIAGGGIDVALVDVAMPRMDGLSMTRLARASHDLPIILVTARDLPFDQVAGLDAGADDYVTKPYDGDVLAARIRAAVRRQRPARREAYVIADARVDAEAMTVTRGGEPLLLSATEMRLLLALIRAEGRVMSRSELLREVWNDETWTDERVVDTNVQRLRGKLGVDAITTVRGFGYKAIAERAS
ncbi:response regulator transcription factor [Rarobacter incanus]|uniref:DNA-binding response OmpR family regulator n=1 Tax=Rarobacter incanus TaxID=153494 RepID=A0A542SQN4_9MICO|nr:response regulator transcription factor [Rarobacter incanus]TQK76914.1 DNA-binding response OmpR family regulator [Rarobacter incanus]